MLNAIKTQKMDNYILKDDAFVAISHFGNSIILTVAGRCDGEIRWRNNLYLKGMIAGRAQMPVVIAVSRFHFIPLFAVHYIPFNFWHVICNFKKLNDIWHNHTRSLR